MTTLRRTPTNSGDDADGRVWGIEGAQRLYLVMGALLLSLLVFLLGSLRFHLANGTAIGLACLPTALAIALARYQQTHAPGHLTDLVELWLVGPSFGPPKTPASV